MAHSENGETYYAVHEVFYTDKGKICEWTEEPIEPIGHSKEDLLEVLENMLKDCKNQEVLDFNMEPEGSFD